MISTIIKRNRFFNPLKIICIGDSTTEGSNGSTGNGPMPEINTAFYFSTNNILRIMNPDVIAAPAGTQYPKCAIDLKNSINRDSMFITAGISGSYISSGGSPNWSPSGTLYNIMKSTNQINISKTGIIPNFIYISLSINDVQNAIPLQDIYDAWDSLISRLQTDFPNIPICIDKIGVDAATMSTRVTSVQTYIASLASSSITIIEGMSAMDGLGYMADSLHPTQTGNNYRGALIADWVESNL